MKSLDHNLRKAAIIVATLDSASVDAILEQLSESQARLVRNAVMELDAFSDHEQQAVLAEFLQRDLNGSPAVELDLSSIAELESLEVPLEPQSADEPESHSTPFDFLAEATAAALVQFLRREHPQMIALVLSHLPPDRAAEVVLHLDPDVQVDALKRLAHIDQTERRIPEQVEQEVEQQLRDRFMLLENRSSGAAAVQAIVQAARSSGRDDLYQKMIRSAPQLAPRPEVTAADQRSRQTQAKTSSQQKNPQRPPDEAAQDVTQDRRKSRPQAPPIEFTQLELLPDKQWQVLLRNADQETVLVALAGADESLVNRIYKQLPFMQAEEMRRAMNQIGPLRLSDIERAQQRLANVASSLAARGDLEIPPRSRFAVAA